MKQPGGGDDRSKACGVAELRAGASQVLRERAVRCVLIRDQLEMARNEIDSLLAERIVGDEDGLYYLAKQEA
jgi:hypothetical protein